MAPCKLVELDHATSMTSSQAKPVHQPNGKEDRGEGGEEGGEGVGAVRELLFRLSGDIT